MTPHTRRAIVLLGILYLTVGLVFGALAARAAGAEGPVFWRRAAWIVSGIAFGGHIVYEQVRLHYPPKLVAFHVSMAAALGAFGLAAAANIHAVAVAPHRPSVLLLVSLAVWPLLTLLPAFAAAFVASELLARVGRRNPAG